MEHCVPHAVYPAAQLLVCDAGVTLLLNTNWCWSPLHQNRCNRFGATLLSPSKHPPPPSTILWSPSPSSLHPDCDPSDHPPPPRLCSQRYPLHLPYLHTCINALMSMRGHKCGPNTATHKRTHGEKKPKKKRCLLQNPLQTE